MISTAVITDALGPGVPLMASSPNQWIAHAGMMLRVLVGSGVHGTSIAGQDDRDEMGVCVEPPHSVIGSREFKHYTFRTKPEGVCSGLGDLDLVVYGLRRYCGLAAQGNPTVLLPLFVPDQHVCYISEFGRELRDRRGLFVSKDAGRRFLGYLDSQRKGLMGLRSGGTRNQGRAELRARYGFDAKFAMHMVRLGVQGLELMTRGTITLPIPEPELTWLRELRCGERTKQEALDRAAELESRITKAMTTEHSQLPDHADRQAIDSWMIDVHRRHWNW